MIARERARLDREIPHECGRKQMVTHLVLPELLDQLAVADALRGPARCRACPRTPTGASRRRRGVICSPSDSDSEPYIVSSVHSPAEVVLLAVGHRDHGGAEHVLRGGLHQVLRQRRHRVVVAVGLVRLEHRELRGVRGVGALVAEVAVDLEDLLDAADQRALEEQLGRDPQVQVDVERVHVRDERPRRGAARAASAASASRSRRSRGGGSCRAASARAPGAGAPSRGPSDAR